MRIKLPMMLAKSLAVAGAFTLLAAVSSANASLIDFTSNSYPGINGATSFSSSTDGVGWTLSVVSGGNMNNSETSTGTTCSSLGLACNRDGVGISDDEITAGTTIRNGEVLRLTFDAPVNVSQLMFLDMFLGTGGGTNEEAKVRVNDTPPLLTFGAVEGAGTSGALLANVLLLGVTSFDFTAFPPNNTDDATNDYAFAGVRFDPAREVPIPGALPLFASGLGVLGFAGWRKRRNSKLAA